MLRKTLIALALAALLPSLAAAHCQIPCGIYGDETRFTILEEHVTTIEKSMKTITELGSAGELNYNQIVRWTNNKEAHADEIAEIVTEYFLQQRLKPTDPANAAAHAKYVKELSLCHGLLVHAMKAKQTTDLAHVEKMRMLIHDFAHSYMGAGHKH